MITANFGHFLTFDFLLKPPQRVTGLFLKYVTMMLPGPFEYISEKESSENQSFLDKEAAITPFSVPF